MKKQIVYSSFLAMLVALTFSACKKQQEVDNETQTVVDNALCEQQFMAVAPVVNEKGAGSPKNQGFKINICGTGDWFYPANTGATPTATPGLFATGEYTAGAQTFTIDYGTGLCNDADGMKKEGKILITSTHKWSIVDSLANQVTPAVLIQPTVTVTFDGYKADGVTYTGSVILTKPSLNTIRVKVINGHCSSGSWNIDFSCDKNITLTKASGITTASIWGTSSGTNREGRTFETSIAQSTPIIKKSNYKYITSGVVDVTPNGFKTRTVDFGNGTDDNNATFTVNGQTISFTMQ